MEENTVQVPEQQAAQPKWVIAKLVVGILSMVLFCVVALQSCAAGLGNTMTNNGETSGSFGFLVALNLLITGIIAVAARKSVKKTAWILCTALLWLNYFFAKMFGGSYSDLVIWGFVSFAFGVFYLFSAMRTKKGCILAAVASAVYLAIALL